MAVINMNIIVDGASVVDDVSSCSISMDYSNYCMSITLNFINGRVWNICDPVNNFGDLRIKVIMGSVTYQFLLEDRNTVSSDSGITFSVWGRSKQALLATPFSQMIKDEETTEHLWQMENTSVKDIITHLITYFTNGRSITVNWYVEDFIVYKSMLVVSNQSPIDLISTLADIVGAQLVPEVDGSLSIRAYSVEASSTVASYNDIDEIFSLGESIRFPVGYNAISLHGYGDALAGGTTDDPGLQDTTAYLDIRSLSDTIFYLGRETVVRVYYYHASLLPSIYFPEGTSRFLGNSLQSITEKVAYRYGIGSTSMPNFRGITEVISGSNDPVEWANVTYLVAYADFAVSPSVTTETILAFYFADYSAETDTVITALEADAGSVGTDDDEDEDEDDDTNPDTPGDGGDGGTDDAPDTPNGDDDEGEGADPIVIDWDFCGSIIFEKLNSDEVVTGGIVELSAYYADNLMAPSAYSNISPTLSKKTGLTLSKSEDITFTDGYATVDYPIFASPTISFIETDISYPVQWRSGSNRIYCLGLYNNSNVKSARANVTYYTRYVVFFEYIPSTYSSTIATYTLEFSECSNTKVLEVSVTEVDLNAYKDITIIARNYATSALLSTVSVYIDGVYRGVTNSVGELLVEQVRVGAHTLRLTKSGYLPSDMDDIANDSFVVV